MGLFFNYKNNNYTVRLREWISTTRAINQKNWTSCTGFALIPDTREAIPLATGKAQCGNATAE